MPTNIQELTPDELPEFTKELLTAFRELIVSETYKDVSIDGYIRPTLEKWRQILDERITTALEQSFDQFLLESGYQELGEYEAGIEITQLNQVVTVGEYMYRVSPNVGVPYTTSGDWSDDQSDFVQIDFVTASQLAAERDQRNSADSSLQDQITEAAPIAAAERPIVQWHGQVIENSFSIPQDVNAFSFGPEITIAAGQEVTLGSGSSWTIANGSMQ